MSLKKTGLSCLLILTVVASLALALSRGRSEELSASKWQDREKAAKSIRRDYDDRVKDLIKLAGKEVKLRRAADGTMAYPHRDGKHLAILLLGDLRAVKAVPILLENLEYKNPITHHWGPFGVGGWYPAAESLSKIGMPAVGPVLYKLGGYEKDGKGRQLCTWAVIKVLGQRLAKERLEMAIIEEGDHHHQRTRKNLAAARHYFERGKAPGPRLK